MSSANPLGVIEAMFARACVREFTTDVIPDGELREILLAAARAPSSKNTQPWQVFLLRGAALEALRTEYLAEFDSGVKPHSEYRYSPDPLPELWTTRARQVGFSLFSHKGIGREDREKRRAHDRENFAFFGAPQMLFLATRKGAQAGTHMDCGHFFQSLMLGLVARGYGSCPMYSVMSYPEVLRKHIPGSEDVLFLAGLALGKPKPGSHVNAFRTERAALEEWYKVVE